MVRKKQKKEILWTATALAALAGIIYNSWPLGFWLNPAVSIHGGLASELEGLNQPYNWLFIGLDLVCGILVTAVVVILWRKQWNGLRKAALMSFSLFGLLTMVDALLPMPCAPSLTQCPGLDHQPILILHGIASIGAAIFLFVSAFLVWYEHRRYKVAFTMSLLMAGWTIFGILSIYFFYVPGPGYLSQDYYLILCGAWMALLPRMLAKRPIPAEARN